MNIINENFFIVSLEFHNWKTEYVEPFYNDIGNCISLKYFLKISIINILVCWTASFEYFRMGNACLFLIFDLLFWMFRQARKTTTLVTWVCHHVFSTCIYDARNLFQYSKMTDGFFRKIAIWMNENAKNVIAIKR